MFCAAGAVVAARPSARGPHFFPVKLCVPFCPVVVVRAFCGVRGGGEFVLFFSALLEVWVGEESDRDGARDVFTDGN